MRPFRESRLQGQYLLVRNAPIALLTLISLLAILRTTRFSDPPRFDGAGYAVLAKALASGQGYREIDRPGAPRHGHFPPGYPAFLAVLWITTRSMGSVVVARLASVACTVGAVLLSWKWYQRIVGTRSAIWLGLALSLNWTWNRVGGAIQSEPLYLLLAQAALLVTSYAIRRPNGSSAMVLGLLLGTSVLVRQVGLALAIGCTLTLLSSDRLRTATTSSVIWVVMLIPWSVWLAFVGDNTQAERLFSDGSLERLFSQCLFYFERLPDCLTGPFVEVATVFRRNSIGMWLARLWASAVVIVLVTGAYFTVMHCARRVTVIVAMVTMGLLLVWPFQEAGRFLVPLIPCLLALAAVGLSRILTFSGRRFRRDQAAFVLFVLTLPYSLYALLSNRADSLAATHHDFDQACAWLLKEATQPGPVISSHPAEVFWQTGRQGFDQNHRGFKSLQDEIRAYEPAYLILDQDRYAGSPTGTLEAMIQNRPDSFREVFRAGDGRTGVSVVEIRRP